MAPSASSSPRAPSVLEVPAGAATTAPAVAHHGGQLLQSPNCTLNSDFLEKLFQIVEVLSIIQTYSNHHHLCHNWRAGESEKFLSDELKCHGQLMPSSMFFKKCSRPRPLKGTNQTAKMLLSMGWTSSPANPNVTKLTKQNSSD